MIVVIGCYGINDEDSDSGKSNDTDSPTELWFCDACKLGVQPVSNQHFVLCKTYVLIVFISFLLLPYVVNRTASCAQILVEFSKKQTQASKLRRVVISYYYSLYDLRILFVLLRRECKLIN